MRAMESRVKEVVLCAEELDIDMDDDDFDDNKLSLVYELSPFFRLYLSLSCLLASFVLEWLMVHIY